VLYSFTAGTTAVSRFGSLIFDQNGALYGATIREAANAGTVFKLTPRQWPDRWSETCCMASRTRTQESASRRLIFDQKARSSARRYLRNFERGAVFKLTPPLAGRGGPRPFCTNHGSARRAHPLSG